MSQHPVEEKKYPAQVSATFAGTTLLAALPFEVLAHLGPTGLLVGGLASYVAWKHGPELYDMARDTLTFLPALESGGQGEAEQPESASAKQGRSFWDRALGIYPDRDDEQVQEAAQESPAQEEDYQWYDNEDTGMPRVESSMFTFSQLLASGFKPTLRKIFLGRLSDGTDVFVEAKDLCHIALAGSTGQGKTSLMRLIMAQLCSIRVNVVLLNPHYMVYDRDHDEDWTPFTPYLARNPLDYVKAGSIAFLLKWMIEKTLTRRMELARAGKSVGKPYFVIIDELPAIVAERKECASYVAKLLREGRKYGLFLIVASQDFQVKTIGMDGSGAVRKCFRTACYVGGDVTTATVLLEKQATPIPETDLGKGVMMLRCSATRQAVLATVPYCDNDALYRLLGPSTYKPSASINEEADDMVVSEEEVNALVDELRARPDIDEDDSRYESDESVHKHAPVPRDESQAIVPILAEKGRQAEEIDLNAAIAVYNTGATSRYQLAKIFGLSENQGRKLKEMIEEKAKPAGR